MTHPGWLRLSLTLLLLLSIGPAAPVLAGSLAPLPAQAGVDLPIPCTSLFAAGCRPEIELIIWRWLMAHGLRWDPARWGVPAAVEFDRTGRWQRVSLLCVHVVRP